MTSIPLVVNFQGDFVLQLVPVETSLTMTEVAAACAYHSLNRRVKPQPDKKLCIRIQGSDQAINDDVTVEEAGFNSMETIEVYYE